MPPALVSEAPLEVLQNFGVMMKERPLQKAMDIEAMAAKPFDIEINGIGIKNLIN
jgi:hypothetical protein